MNPPTTIELREWAARLRELPQQSVVIRESLRGLFESAYPEDVARFLEALAAKYEQDYVEDARQ